MGPNTHSLTTPPLTQPTSILFHKYGQQIGISWCQMTYSSPYHDRVVYLLTNSTTCPWTLNCTFKHVAAAQCHVLIVSWAQNGLDWNGGQHRQVALYVCMCWCMYVCVRVYTHTYSLTPCSTVLPEKLTVPQPVKKFPTFYGTRRFITAFTSARHLSLSWARSI